MCVVRVVNALFRVVEVVVTTQIVCYVARALCVAMMCCQVQPSLLRETDCCARASCCEIVVRCSNAIVPDDSFPSVCCKHTVLQLVC